MADTGRDRVLSETAIRTATGARGEPQEMTRMRIAQVAPLYESVPPRLYGGTERVVSFLTEELVRFGHEVLEAAGEGTKMADHLSPSFRPAFPSSAIISERSSLSRVRSAAPNNGAPLTAPGRSGQRL